MTILFEPLMVHPLLGLAIEIYQGYKCLSLPKGLGMVLVCVVVIFEVHDVLGMDVDLPLFVSLCDFNGVTDDPFPPSTQLDHTL
jgi:hypothetical protein